MIKKKIEKKEEEKIKEETEKEKREKLVKMERKHEEQMRWAIIIIIFIILGFAGAYLILQNINKFQYVGVNWEKIKYGELDFYHGRFPLFDNYYNIYMRTDPRKNEIPVKNITLKIFPVVIVALEPEAGGCYGANIGSMELGKFFGAVGSKVISAINDEKTAKEYGTPFANCSFTNQTTVVMLQKSETPSITQSSEYPNCYILNVGECENTKTVEKFLLTIIAGMHKKEIN